MGIDYTAYGIMGYKFELTDNKQIIKTRGCNHSDTGNEYCSSCGKKTWVDKTVWNTQFDDIYEEFLEPMHEDLNKIFGGRMGKVVAQNNTNYVVFGKGFSLDRDDERIQTMDISSSEFIMNSLQSLLIKYDIESQCMIGSFGLHYFMDAR